MRFFIIHGAYGNPNENWFPWLKKELEKIGYEVIVPAFPTPENQNLENWMKVFQPYLKEINEETIFIGHSLGVAFILSVLEKINLQVRACFFVSGFAALLGNKIDVINRTFIEKNFDWEKIKNNSKEFYIYHADNDPYVPLNRAKRLATKLNCTMFLIEKAGHFNSAAGFDTFKELLGDLRAIK